MLPIQQSAADLITTGSSILFAHWEPVVTDIHTHADNYGARRTRGNSTFYGGVALPRKPLPKPPTGLYI